ncbi:hypothetical protein FHG87_000872 [Trinorchestia longiramus]|nr:hypothetical protein FHG87_000872 [Trinorchestia longiramus]
MEDSEGNDRISYKKVAIVEDFFEIIYNLHVCKDGKEQKHMGQKRTYRAVSERYAFVPREAVTKFLVLCTECPRRTSAAPVTSLHPNLHNNNNNSSNTNNNLHNGDKALIMKNNNVTAVINGVLRNDSVSPSKLEKRNVDVVRPSKSGSAFQPINSSSRNGSSGGKKYTGIPSTHLSPSSPLTTSHPLSPNSHSFLPMTPTHPTPHSIISFLPSPSPSLSSHSISSMLPDHSNNSAAIASQSYNPIDVVNHACINSIGSANPHSLSSIPSLNSVSHSNMLTSSLSLASPFQLPGSLLQSPLSLSHHLPHPGNLLHNQLTPPLTPIAHMTAESPAKGRVKSPKRSTKACSNKSSSGSKISSTSSAIVNTSSLNNVTSAAFVSSPSKSTICSVLPSSKCAIVTASETTVSCASPMPSLCEVLGTAGPAISNFYVNTNDVLKVTESEDSLKSSVSSAESVRTCLPTTSSVDFSSKEDQKNSVSVTSISTSENNEVQDVKPIINFKPDDTSAYSLCLKDEKNCFDTKVSDFSSSINYSMPITTIYLKHMRNIEQQKHREEALYLEREEEKLRQIRAVELQHLNEEMAMRNQELHLLWQQHQRQQFVEDQDKEHQSYQLRALQMQILQENAKMLPVDSVTIKTESLERSNSFPSPFFGMDSKNGYNLLNGFIYKDGGGLNPNHGDGSAAGGTVLGASSVPDASATDDSKSDVKMETRGSEWVQQPAAPIKTDAVTNAKNSPCPSPSLSDPPASIADDSSTGGGRDEDDEEDDPDDDKVDAHHDPERLKAFNMFVRLFVDENLDRMVPISKQPKDKIQAIIDACGRQFPEFSERTRKRIRTYLKSCRRNKRTRDSNGWEGGRPTPPHLTSLQAEQLLATACENEAQNAKRMRLGLDPVAQPHPYQQQQQPAIAVVGSDKGVTFMDVAAVVAKSEVGAKAQVVEGRVVNGTSGGGVVGVTAGGVTVFQPVVTSLSATTCATQPATVYHQSLPQTYQKVVSTNGPTDLSMRSAASQASSSLSSTSGGSLMSSVSSGGGNVNVLPTSATLAVASGNNIVITNNSALNGIGVNTNSSMNSSSMLGVNAVPCNTSNNCTSISNATVVNNMGSGGVVVTNNPSAVNTNDNFGSGQPCAINMSNSNAVSSSNPPAAPPSSGKSRPSLSPVEVAAVRQLITGYRESAAFLLRSAEELQNLIHQQNS